MKTLKIKNNTTLKEIKNFIDDEMSYNDAEDIIDLIVKSEISLNEIIYDLEREDSEDIILNNNIDYSNKIQLINLYHEVFIDGTLKPEEYEKSKYNVITCSLSYVMRDFKNFLNDSIYNEKEQILNELDYVSYYDLEMFIDLHEDEKMNVIEILDYFNMYSVFFQ